MRNCGDKSRTYGRNEAKSLVSRESMVTSSEIRDTHLCDLDQERRIPQCGVQEDTHWKRRSTNRDKPTGHGDKHHAEKVETAERTLTASNGSVVGVELGHAHENHGNCFRYGSLFAV